MKTLKLYVEAMKQMPNWLVAILFFFGVFGFLSIGSWLLALIFEGNINP